MITSVLGLRFRVFVAIAGLLAIGVPAAAEAASFAPPVSYLTGGIRPSSVAVADFDGDGRNDLAVANGNSDTMSVLSGLAVGYGPPDTYAVGSAPISVATGYLNGDDRPDIVVANRLSAGVSVMLGAAGGGFSPATAFAAGNQPYAVAVGDVNGDSNDDVLVANRVSDDVSVLLGDGSGSLSAPASVPAGNGPHALAAGDLDDDGDLDLAVALFDGDLMSILLGDGAGHFSAPALYTASNGPQSVALGFLSEDGRLDVAVANFFNDVASVFLGTGGGLFSSQSLYGAGDGPKSLAIGDLDGDGHEDIAVADSESDLVTVLEGNGLGGFAPPQAFPAGDSPASIAIAQLDGVGLPDVVVAARFGEVVSVLTNAGVPRAPVDRTPPTIKTPGPLSVDATSPAGAEVVYAVSAQDETDPEPTVSCAPGSGSIFPNGTTTVRCTASDDAGNVSEATFDVSVVALDTQAPTITVPDRLTVNATSPAGAVVTYVATATDDRDPNPSLVCVPASGSVFRIGATTGECTARDASGNTSTASVAVYVKGAPEQIVDVIDKIRAIKNLAPVAPTLRLYLQGLAAYAIDRRKDKSCGLANTFVAAVRIAVSKRYLTAAQGDGLVADMQRIKAVIGCG